MRLTAKTSSHYECVHDSSITSKESNNSVRRLCSVYRENVLHKTYETEHPPQCVLFSRSRTEHKVVPLNNMKKISTRPKKNAKTMKATGFDPVFLGLKVRALNQASTHPHVSILSLTTILSRQCGSLFLCLTSKPHPPTSFVLCIEYPLDCVQ